MYFVFNAKQQMLAKLMIIIINMHVAHLSLLFDSINEQLAWLLFFHSFYSKNSSITAANFQIVSFWPDRIHQDQQRQAAVTALQQRSERMNTNQVCTELRSKSMTLNRSESWNYDLFTAASAQRSTQRANNSKSDHQLYEFPTLPQVQWIHS